MTGVQTCALPISQQACKKIETEKKAVREQTFDNKGFLVSLDITDSDGVLLESNVWERDLEDRLVSFSKIKKDQYERTEWTYAKGDSILEKCIFLNDSLISKSIYTNNENWIETILYNSVPILAVKWIDGVRVDDVKK